MNNITYLLPHGVNYYKTNLHTHTNITDAVLSPEQMKAAYKARGYSILALTDHNVIADHSYLNDEDFLMLTGAEFNVNEQPFERGCGKTCHMNFIAKRPDNLWQPFRYYKPYKDVAQPYLEKAQIDDMPQVHDTESINNLIAEANRHGFLVMYNHPHWSLHDYTDYAGLKGLWALEHCNFGSSNYGDRDNSTVYRDLLNQGNRLFPVGADDSHNEAKVGGAWIMLGAEQLEYGSVIKALEKGDFYTSTGPEIFDLYLEDRILKIRCSDARWVSVSAGVRFATRSMPVAPNVLLRETSIDMSKWFDMCEGAGNRAWFKVTVYGPYGDYAATRAFWLDEL